MATSPPPYAWDWYARQRIVWRVTRARLSEAASLVALRYADLSGRNEVVAQLRQDYVEEPLVRDVVDEVVAELAFLGRTGAPFEALGVRLPPRGMRWWWEHLTGERVGAPPPVADRRALADARARRQLTLEDVHEGYGDR